MKGFPLYPIHLKLLMNWKVLVINTYDGFVINIYDYEW